MEASLSNPQELKYTEDHEWVRIESGVATVGITAHAQDALGDIVFVQLPEVGGAVEAGESVSELESVKAVSDVYAPLSGTILEVNEGLDGAEGQINSDPYGTGWMFKIQLGEPAQLEGLMTAAGYESFLGDEA